VLVVVEVVEDDVVVEDCSGMVAKSVDDRVLDCCWIFFEAKVIPVAGEKASALPLSVNRKSVKAAFGYIFGNCFSIFYCCGFVSVACYCFCK